MALANRYDAQLTRCIKIALKFGLKETSLSPEEIYGFFYPDKSGSAAEKAFKRDRELLALIGVQISYDDRSNCYSLDTTHAATTPLELSREESAALGVALKSMVAEPTFPLPLALQFALLKIEGRLQDDTDEDMILAQLTLDDNASQQQRSLELLIGAIKNQRLVSFCYTNALGSESTRVVAPYGLNQYKGQWYLIGLDRDNSQEIRTFSVANIDECETTDETFEMPQDFDLDAFCTPPFLWGGGSMRQITLIIPANIAHRSKNITTGLGTCTVNLDGSVAWTTHYRDLDELCQFIITERLKFPDEDSDEKRYFIEEYLERVVNAHV